MSKIVHLAALSHLAALDAVREVMAAGAELGVAFAVSVVDPSLRVLASAQANSTNPTAAETSRRAANTAIADDRPSGWMPEQFQVIVPLSTGNVSTNMPGGFPIRIEGQLVAAIGIAGADGDDVSTTARRALAAIDADPVDEL